MKQLSDFVGLSQEEAKSRLKKEGFNELSAQKKQSIFKMLLSIISEPMILLLLGAGGVYLFMGEPGDSIMLLFAVIAVISLTLYQEVKTEKTLEALRDLSSPRALVWRDQKQQMIAGKEVVLEDIIYIHEGDRIPADALVLSNENLSVDESLLTGESITVRKVDWLNGETSARPGGDDKPFVYSGSLVTSGRAIIKVTATGLKTEIGKIGKSLESIKDEKTLLHQETASIVRRVAAISLFLCFLVVLFSVLIKNDLVGGLLAGLTLAMAILPEEFPVVLTVFLALGAWRISRHNVLTRRAAAIETLGAATVLCTDKTGTLTFNKMELEKVFVAGNYLDLKTETLNSEAKELLKIAVLASQQDLFDPIEKELQLKKDLYLSEFKKEDSLEIVKEYPLTKDFLALSHVWHFKKETNKYLIASKGAPETILKLCHLSAVDSSLVMSKVKEMSTSGLRVLGVAKADFTGDSLPLKQQDFSFQFVGLLAFMDQIRPSVYQSVKEAKEAGIRVIMITGDYPGTAQAIATQIGLENPSNFLTGTDLEQLSELELAAKIKVTNVFARVYPEQKLLIVNALKANKEIVAMTGDGVNDAPALKAAHIGVAMGGRGTDVAREASALILLDDDFSSIVSAVRLGRRIYSNLKHSMGYLLGVHVPIAGISMLPIFLDLPVILFPAHVAFLELIIDPACTLVFEAKKEDDSTMKVPPRNIQESMFSRKNVMLNLGQGLSVFLGLCFLFYLSVTAGYSDEKIRSFIFSGLVIGNLLMIVINISWHKSIFRVLRRAERILILVSLGTITALGLVICVPFLANLFDLAPLSFKDLSLIIVVISLSLSWFEVSKFFRK